MTSNSYNFDETENTIAKGKWQSHISDQLEKAKHLDEKGDYYWLARDFILIFGLNNYAEIARCLDKAFVNCIEAGIAASSLFPHFTYLPERNRRKDGTYINNTFDQNLVLVNFRLSFYGCYCLARAVKSSYPRLKKVDAVLYYFYQKVVKSNLFSLLTIGEKAEELFPVSKLKLRYGIPTHLEVKRRNYLGMKTIKVKRKCFVTQQQLEILDALDDWIVKRGGKMEDFDPKLSKV